VFDLMIHDIDVMCSLVHGGFTGIHAVGTSPRSEQCDYAVAQFEFEDEVLATATASHVTHGKVRRLDVTTMDAFITLNYQQQDVTVQRRGVEHTTTTHASQQGYRTETVTESPFIRTREPLERELEHFLECVSTGRRPRVDGDAGVRAVELASEVASQIRTEGSSTAPW
jgi:predicted dehydrogenase